jgi:hypothetical protein
MKNSLGHQSLLTMTKPHHLLSTKELTNIEIISARRHRRAGVFFSYWSTFTKLAFSEIESMTRPFKKSATFTDGHNFGLNPQGH